MTPELLTVMLYRVPFGERRINRMPSTNSTSCSFFKFNASALSKARLRSRSSVDEYCGSGAGNFIARYPVQRPSGSCQHANQHQHYQQRALLLGGL
jgi:hypothetical protein